MHFTTRLYRVSSSLCTTIQHFFIVRGKPDQVQSLQRAFVKETGHICVEHITFYHFEGTLCNRLVYTFAKGPVPDY